MRTILALVLALALATAALGLPASPSGAATSPRTWYVDADARAAGTGSAGRPFASLAAAQAASGRGDTIRVLPSTRRLDGGIRLKRDQRLVGDGPTVTGLPETAPAPTLTNTGTRLAGDAVRLADGAVVRNLRFRDTRRGAVLGRDVTGVRVVGNDVAGHNAACVPGFLIPQFNAPTNVPGVGIPIVGGLPNGWAGIQVDANSRTGATAYVASNVVHHSDCGDGIDVRVWDTASYAVTVRGNRVHHLRQGKPFKSVLALGFQARDRAALTAHVLDNRQAALGNLDDLNVAVAGADSEGVFLNGVGPARLDVVVERNTYTNTDGVGGFSANGLEMVSMGAGTRMSAVVRDSHFSGSPGDVIEEGALGTDARLDLRLERVTAERSTGTGNTGLLPFNNGDCVLAGSLGAGNDVRLVVRDSILRDCANNGLAMGSNVVNGRGPTRALRLDVARTTITGNRAGNLGVRNFTALEHLAVVVSDSDLAGSGGVGSSLADVALEDLGHTASAAIDLGGGTLGSTGANCVSAEPLALDVLGYDVAARRVWWGTPAGPGLLSAVAVGGTLDVGDPLDARPAHCHPTPG